MDFYGRGIVDGWENPYLIATLAPQHVFVLELFLWRLSKKIFLFFFVFFLRILKGKILHVISLHKWNVGSSEKVHSTRIKNGRKLKIINSQFCNPFAKPSEALFCFRGNGSPKQLKAISGSRSFRTNKHTK